MYKVEKLPKVKNIIMEKEKGHKYGNSHNLTNSLINEWKTAPSGQLCSPNNTQVKQIRENWSCLANE